MFTTHALFPSIVSPVRWGIKERESKYQIPRCWRKRNRPRPNRKLCLKGPKVFQNYLNQPQITKDSFTPDGYHKTGGILYNYLLLITTLVSFFSPANPTPPHEIQRQKRRRISTNQISFPYRTYIQSYKTQKVRRSPENSWERRAPHSSTPPPERSKKNKKKSALLRTKSPPYTVLTTNHTQHKKRDAAQENQRWEEHAHSIEVISG